MTIHATREAAAAQQQPASGAPLISDDTLRQLYSAMLQCRALEERTRALIKRKKPVEFPNVGQQEAILAGVTMDLRPEDMIAPSQGSFIAEFVKGAPLSVTLRAMQSLIAASSAGKTRRSPVKSTDHASAKDDAAPVLPPASVAAQLTIATGLALANKRKQAGSIVVVFLSSRWASGGVEDEALRFAGVHRLPILYVVRDNMDAETASGNYGFPGIPVDGNDLVALYRVAHEAIKRARQGGGPTLMDCKLYLRRGRIDPDKGETDAVAKMERYLAARKLFSQDWKRQTMRAFKAELDAALKQTRRP